MTTAPRGAPWARAAGAAVLCLALAAWQTAPAWASRGAGLIVGGGEEPDWHGTLWTWWWTWEAIASGRPFWEVAQNFHPVGQRPLAWFNVVDALSFGPLIHLLGPIRGYNLACILVLASTGLGGAALGRAAGCSPRGALLAGLALQLSTFVSTELVQGRVGQAWLLPALLAVAALTRLAQAPSRRRALSAGLLTALCGYTYWFYGLFVAAAGAAILVVAPGDRRRRFVPSLQAAALCLGCMLPALIVLLGAWSAQPGVTGTADPILGSHPLAAGSHALSFAISTAHWPLWPVLDTPLDLSDKRVHPLALGLAALGALGLGRSKAAAGRLAWLLTAGAGWVLTLGPYLRTRAGVQDIPLPWLLLHDHLPFFSRLWWPERAELLVWVGLVPLMGLAVDGLLERRPWPRWWARLGFLAILGGLVLPHRSQPLRAGPTPPVDLQLYGGVDGAILTLPVMGDEHSRKLLWLQAHHGHPILGGLGDHLPGHRPVAFEDFVGENPLLAYLRDLSSGRAAETTVQPEDVRSLRDAGFTTVVADAAGVRPGLDRRWMATWDAALQPLLGLPDVRVPAGLAWQLQVPDGPVTLPALGPVERGVPSRPVGPLQR